MYHNWGLQYKCTTGFTHEYLPLTGTKSITTLLESIHHSLVITSKHYLTCTTVQHCKCKYLYMHSDQYWCIPRALENITRVICEMCRGMQKSMSVSVNLDVRCTICRTWFGYVSKLLLGLINFNLKSRQH